MKKILLRLGLLSLMLVFALMAKAQGEKEGTVKEKAIYSTDFTEWTAIDRKKATNVVVDLKTRYSKEAFSFTLNGVGVDPAGVNDKFSDRTGYLITAKYTGEYGDAEPTAITSPLSNITKIVLHQAATGGKRGIKVSVKGDGDADWVAIHNVAIQKSSGEDLTLEVNRNNCQIKLENFALAQNAYVTDFAIYGNVDLGENPALDKYTLTYYNIDGKSVLGTQQVEEDAKIGSFLQDAVNKVTVADGKKFRGWGKNLKLDEKKYTENTVVTGNIDLYALVSDIETANATARYDYNLQKEGFCADDHEAFSVEGNGKWHDGTHGWAFSAGDQIKVLMGGKGFIKLNLCQFTGDGKLTLTTPQGEEVASIEAKAGKDGALAILQNPSTESGEYTIHIEGTTYIHKLSIVNMTEPAFVQDGNWYRVKAGDAKSLLTTLEIVNGNNAEADAARSFIFLPNGTYDLGETALTTISGNNISIIGEDMDKTIIKNKPAIENEGIGTTATLLNTSNHLYLQDLTLQNALEYYKSGSAGRAVCLQDRGNQTICKNVKMLSYQDTYYSNEPNGKGQFYFEDSEIHGTVDYVCGGGDVFFNRVVFVNESRKENEKSGEDVIAAPNSKSEWGYIFKDCTIENKAKAFSLGRSWNNTTRLTWLNTTVNQKNEILNDDKKYAYFTINAMGEAMADKFRLDILKDANGNVFSPKEKKVIFKNSAGNKQKDEENIILSADDAAQYTLENVFGEWKPAEQAAQRPAVETTLTGDKLSWTGDAQMYLVLKNGNFFALTAENSIDLESGETGNYTVRAANPMGGFGKVGNVATGIRNTQTTGAQAVKTTIYTVDGTQQSQLQKGINIVVKTLADGSKEINKMIIK